MEKKNNKEFKKIIYKKINYDNLSINEVERLAKEIGFQSECDGDNKIVKISLDLKNN